MLFNSFEFFIFFPVVTILYFVLPQRFRWLWLLAASCYFYMNFIPYYILILVLTIIVDYFAAIKISETFGRAKRAWLVLSIISTCLILFVFKYYGFFTDNVNNLVNLLHWNYPITALKIILPIGLSFHTFQSLSYVIEVYRGNQKPERHFGIYALYVMFYPQLVAGPIERPQNLLHQFREHHIFDYERIKSGLLLMLWGLFKKIVIADRLSIYVNQVYNHPNYYHGFPVILATLFFAVQIYCDFSGYSDIAIGSARVMGFKLMTNFNKPYLAKSISEFWKRWHISLSTWFKDYVYIPLGGNRVSVPKWYFNLFITFLISGLWHGANWTFIIWGALHGIFLISGVATHSWRNKISEKFGIFRIRILDQLANSLFTIFLVFIGWIFFRAKSVTDAFLILRQSTRIFPFQSVKIGTVWGIELIISLLVIVLLFGIEVSSPNKSFEALVLAKRKPLRWTVYTMLLCAIFIVGNFGYVEFIYFQF